MSKSIRLLITGDVFPDLEDGRAAFRHLPALFEPADLVFGGLEGVYSDRPRPGPSPFSYGAAPSVRGSMLGDAGFDVMACASDHMVDCGYEALADTLELLHRQGIATTGAGRDIAEATTPAVLERAGMRVAFLSFCSVFPVGHDAGAERPGIAPLRVQTFYSNPFPNVMWDPGVEPVITFVPLAADIERVYASIDAAREAADVVVIAFHWGYAAEVRSRLSPPRVTHERVWHDRLQDYEIEVARGAVERGADVVVCHHQATLRGVEVHAGKPIFYGLGNFAHHYRHDNPHKRGNATAPQLGGEEFPYLPFTLNEPQNTGVASLELGRDGSIDAGFIPARIHPDGRTEPLRYDDPRAGEQMEHFKGLTAEVGFDTIIEPAKVDGWMVLRIAPGSGQAVIPTAESAVGGAR